MLHNSNSFSWFLILTCLCTIGSHELFAQSIWLDRSHDKTISLEIFKPNFEGEDDFTFATSALFLSGRFKTGNNTSVIGEIPLSHFGIKSDGWDFESENAIGNPYLGIEVQGKDTLLFGEFGIRLPFASKDMDYAEFIGFYTELVDRAEAFITDAVPIGFALNALYKDPSGLFMRSRGGSSIWIATGDREGTDIFLLYSVQIGYESPQFNLITGLSGRWILTGEGSDFSENSFHQFGLACNVAFGAVRPGISLKLPLDEDLSDMLDLVFGLTMSVDLN